MTISGNDKLQADFDANTLAGCAEGGRRFGSVWSGMTPYAAVQVASIRLPGYSEHAISGSHTYAARTGTQTRDLSRHAVPLRTQILRLYSCKPHA